MTIHVDSVGGSNTSPYDTWAKAATTLQAGLTARAAFEDVWWEKDSTESYSTNQTLTCPTDSLADRVHVYRVDNTDDSYAPTTGADTINYQVTGAGTDITRNLSAVWHGIHIKCTDELKTGTLSGEFIECVLDFPNTGTGLFTGIGNADCAEVFRRNTIKISNGSVTCSGGYVLFEGNVYTGTAHTNGLFSGAGARGTIKKHLAEDYSGLGSGTLIVDVSTWADTMAEEHFYACDMPASFALSDNGFANDGQFVYLWSSDSGGNFYVSRIESFRGTVIEDTGTYMTGGFQPEGSTNPVGYTLTAASNVDAGSPLQSIDIDFYYDGATGSSVTFTTELLENFTTQLTDQDFWSELFYLGTSGSTLWSVDSNQQVLGSATNLAAGTGTGNWTGVTGYTSSKVTHTVTPQIKGMYRLRCYLGEYESGKDAVINQEVSAV